MPRWEEATNALNRRQRLQLWWFWSPLTERLRRRTRALLTRSTPVSRAAAGADHAERRVLL